MTTSTAIPSLVTQAHVDDFRRDGVVLIRGLFAGFIDAIRTGIERNLAAPGEHAVENLTASEGGRFFDDYGNWARIPEFERVIRHSPAAAVAAALTGSRRVHG